MGYLNAAYTIIWFVIALFVFYNGTKVKKIEGELTRLEGLVKHNGRR